jgi:cytochrome c oxidase subunit 4
MTSTVQRHEAQHEAHPSAATYVKIALVLLTITIMEVAAFYLEGLRNVLVPVLLLLSAAKFTLVVGYYMHLKFDARLFSAIFIGGLLLAIAIMLALLAVFDNYYLP